MSVKMGVFSGGAGFSVGVSTEESLREMVSNTEKEQREYYIGGSPPSGDYSSGSTETLREWARSAAENPAPIQYKLASIDAIIRPEYFKKKIPGKLIKLTVRIFLHQKIRISTIDVSFVQVNLYNSQSVCSCYYRTTG